VIRVCYTCWMRWWRRSALSRVVALTILLWTGADLSNSSLCALENEGAAAPASAGPGSIGGTIVDGTTPQAPQPVSGHVDDCFCCSHCVDVAGFLPANVATIANSPRVPLVVAAPRIFGSPLYHPPQA